MNRADAKKIAETITRDQLGSMLERAKHGVENWKAMSSVNPHLTKGASWNILSPAFERGGRLSKPAITNMIHEFGDFLPEALKPKRLTAGNPAIDPWHEEPNFGGR